VYTFRDDDLGGTWRVLWTASDECSIHTPYRRIHEHQRMLVANDARAFRRLVLYIDPGHGAYVDRDTRSPEWRGATKTGFESEDQYVLRMASNGCHPRALQLSKSILAGYDQTRWTEYDIGSLDTTGAPKEHYRDWFSTPPVVGFLDRRVAKTKEVLRRHPQDVVFFISLHVNSSGRGCFHVQSNEQGDMLAWSDYLGDMVCHYLAEEMPLPEIVGDLRRDKGRVEFIQVLAWNSQDLWTNEEFKAWSRAHCGGDELFAARFLTGVSTPPPPGARKAYATLIETLQFGGPEDEAILQSPPLVRRVGEYVIEGAAGAYWQLEHGRN